MIIYFSFYCDLHVINILGDNKFDDFNRINQIKGKGEEISVR